ncbi:unnamed protein product [Durusdinium trenchii]|uniref:FYVE-type domain-containing protein n=1 Tax=Durusdinium trenchii TaxID=1381693 RepID=A0ABP0RFP6_9DINO
MAQRAAWVPDEEVSECPLCTQQFSRAKRKHHCRACGRVVCGSCSGSKLFLSSYGKEERVCDSCFDLLQHDKGRPVNEQFVEQKQIEASLKADLREKQQQEEWFRSFLAQVAAANGNAHARAVEELPQLIANGQRRWRETCQQLQKDGEELEQLQEKGNQLELQGRARASSLQELQRTVQHMQKDLKVKQKRFAWPEGPALQSQCDELQRSTILLQQELSGLQQRRAALEDLQERSEGSRSGESERWREGSWSFRTEQGHEVRGDLVTSQPIHCSGGLPGSSSLSFLFGDEAGCFFGGQK